MIQRGSGTSFTAEPLQSRRVASQFIGQKLQGHRTPQRKIDRLVDNTHAAAAQFLGETVMRDL
jgi:hypothetical protein